MQHLVKYNLQNKFEFEFEYKSSLHIHLVQQYAYCTNSIAL